MADCVRCVEGVRFAERGGGLVDSALVDLADSVDSIGLLEEKLVDVLRSAWVESVTFFAQVSESLSESTNIR